MIGIAEAIGYQGRNEIEKSNEESLDLNFIDTAAKANQEEKDKLKKIQEEAIDNSLQFKKPVLSLREEERRAKTNELTNYAFEQTQTNPNWNPKKDRKYVQMRNNLQEWNINAESEYVHALNDAKYAESHTYDVDVDPLFSDLVSGDGEQYKKKTGGSWYRPGALVKENYSRFPWRATLKKGGGLAVGLKSYENQENGKIVKRVGFDPQNLDDPDFEESIKSGLASFMSGNDRRGINLREEVLKENPDIIKYPNEEQADLITEAAYKKVVNELQSLYPWQVGSRNIRTGTGSGSGAAKTTNFVVAETPEYTEQERLEVENRNEETQRSATANAIYKSLQGDVSPDVLRKKYGVSVSKDMDLSQVRSKVDAMPKDKLLPFKPPYRLSKNTVTLTVTQGSAATNKHTYKTSDGQEVTGYVQKVKYDPATFEPIELEVQVDVTDGDSKQKGTTISVPGTAMASDNQSNAALYFSTEKGLEEKLKIAAQEEVNANPSKYGINKQNNATETQKSVGKAANKSQKVNVPLYAGDKTGYSGDVYHPKTREDYDKLPSGSMYYNERAKKIVRKP